MPDKNKENNNTQDPEVKDQTTTPETTVETKKEKTYTQEELNDILKTRLAKEKVKRSKVEEEKGDTEEQLKGLLEREREREIAADVAQKELVKQKNEIFSELIVKHANADYIEQATAIAGFGSFDVSKLTEAQIEEHVKTKLSSIPSLSKSAEGGSVASIAASAAINNPPAGDDTKKTDDTEKKEFYVINAFGNEKELTKEDFDKLSGIHKRDLIRVIKK